MRLRTMLERGYRLHVYCEAVVPGTGQFCYNYTEVRVESLIQRFGWDFEISERRHWFLQHFRCAKCGAREATCRIQNPEFVPDYSRSWVW